MRSLGRGEGNSLPKTEEKTLVQKKEDSKVIDLSELTLTYYMIYMWTTYKSFGSSNQPTRLINTKVITVRTLP